jgi:replication-associated recombination protein RarA
MEREVFIFFINSKFKLNNQSPINNIYIIGPGGVGKTTCGRILAREMDYDFIDLDTEFLSRVGDINQLISHKGKQFYYKKNSEFFRRILEGLKKKLNYCTVIWFLNLW